ncbi:MAG: dicarboxylate/amino acid:cation symporter [Actinomycetota bacterium]|nr:dicarboxylate/amino acid:cation symporter [Actinomycetota bacterium]
MVNGTADTNEQTNQRRPLYKQIYFWVLIGIVLGILVGYFFPSTGQSLEPLGNTFINLIKMVIPPVIFCTVVAGIAGMGSLRSAGRIGVKALVYFEVLTTVALVLGLIVINVVRPGEGVNADPSGIEVNSTVSGYISKGESSHWYDFIFHIVPDSAVGAFANGDVLQVLFFSVLFALALHALGDRGKPIIQGIEWLSQAFFQVIRIVMYAAPIGAFGAMAFAIGKYGIGTLTSLFSLIMTFYATSIFFVLIVLGLVAALAGVNILKLLRYIKEELLIVLGTSSSESVLPQLMRKLEHLGCPRSVVGLTVPSGYSFNLDGTCIYLTLAAVYVAQAQNIDLSIGQQLGIVGVLLLTSKGAAGVTGSGFIVLAATLSSIGTIPVEGIMLIFGIDKFMSECRSLTNLCGNSVASIVVSRWEGAFDVGRSREVLNNPEDELAILAEEGEITGRPVEA